VIAIWAALFVGLLLGAADIRRRQRLTQALLVAGMRAPDDWTQVIAAADAIDKDIEDAVIEDAEQQMAAWFAEGEQV
jgi:hypothetical protein